MDPFVEVSPPSCPTTLIPTPLTDEESGNERGSWVCPQQATSSSIVQGTCLQLCSGGKGWGFRSQEHVSRGGGAPVQREPRTAMGPLPPRASSTPQVSIPSALHVPRDLDDFLLSSSLELAPGIFTFLTVAPMTPP